MENNTRPKYTTSFGLSLAVCSVANAILMIAKEKSQSVMAGMQKATGHHWITHSAVILIVFVFLGWLFARVNNGRGLNMTGGRLNRIIVAGVVTGVVVILGFYLVAG
jgi:hypothetical protein